MKNSVLLLLKSEAEISVHPQSFKRRCFCREKKNKSERKKKEKARERDIKGRERERERKEGNEKARK